MNVADMRAARRQLQAVRAEHSNVVVVVGPPCSGKTTYVRERAGAADVVVDFDALAEAFGSGEQWNHRPSHLRAAHVAREAMIACALNDCQTDHTVWVILTDHAQLDRFGLAGARVVEMDTPLDECERRAVRLGRTPQVLQIIRDWRTAS